MTIRTTANAVKANIARGSTAITHSIRINLGRVWQKSVSRHLWLPICESSSVMKIKDHVELDWQHHVIDVRMLLALMRWQAPLESCSLKFLEAHAAYYALFHGGYHHIANWFLLDNPLFNKFSIDWP